MEPMTINDQEVGSSTSQVERKGNQRVRRGGISWEQIPEMAVDRGAWRELTALVL